MRRPCETLESFVVSLVFGFALTLLVVLTVLTLASCTPEPCMVGIVVNSSVRCVPVR